MLFHIFQRELYIFCYHDDFSHCLNLLSRFIYIYMIQYWTVRNCLNFFVGVLYKLNGIYFFLFFLFCLALININDGIIDIYFIASLSFIISPRLVSFIYWPFSSLFFSSHCCSSIFQYDYTKLSFEENRKKMRPLS